ncbi:MAG: succinate dehydrogenase, hydrophobic membrane anchor protein [Sulfuritalea sp.]|nr:succinate dehydrogenase, hydrophobic membrane anchor protein [Sulfuritalea sp.]MDP1985417.1 succinate dehydrogenase, hydrophobic membrane anchor protein [Sulfuritalea sp.]
MNRLVVGAHYGLMDWLAQRVTAIVMAAYTVVIFAAALGGATASREAWQAFMAHGFIRYISFLFFVSLCWHAWVGVRDIWMDYFNSAALRVILHVLTLLALIGYAGWAVQIIWRL